MEEIEKTGAFLQTDGSPTAKSPPRGRGFRTRLPVLQTPLTADRARQKISFDAPERSVAADNALDLAENVRLAAVERLVGRILRKQKHLAAAAVEPLDRGLVA